MISSEVFMNVYLFIFGCDVVIVKIWLCLLDLFGLGIYFGFFMLLSGNGCWCVGEWIDVVVGFWECDYFMD